MNKIFISFVSSLFAVSVLASCSNKIQEFSPLEPVVQTQNSTIDTVEMPEFSKRKLGKIGIPTNSLNEQKRKQIKLHTFYFNSYSNGAGSYPASANNDHLKMLNKAVNTTGLKLDANTDNKITLEEILKFVTTDAFIKYFRETFIIFSFDKLNVVIPDTKLNVDEFNQFNIKIKAKELPDFQLLEEFSEYDYNSSRGLDIEEYEDFFMKYLLIKVGANR